MANYFRNKIEYLNDDNISIKEKNFMLTSMYAIFASFLMVIVFLLAGLKFEIIEFSIFLLLFSVLVSYLGRANNEITVYTIFYVILFNFFIYPAFYFLTADIYNGVPLYMAMGIILTFFLLDGRILYIIVALEIICDSYLVYYSYHYIDNVEIYHKNSIYGSGIAICFLLASLLPLSIIYYQSYIYKNNHKKIMQSNLTMNAAGVGKSRFLANITREIRTPMNAIFGMVEVILKENLTDESKEQVEIIKTATSDLLTIINNILVYSNLDSGKMELIPVRYNFRDLINDVFQSVILEYASSQTDFTVYVDHNIPKYIYGDDVRIKQVFRYLLFSSLNQLPHGRIALEINCDKNHIDHTIKFKCKISESGRGLTETELKAVFGAYNEYDSRQRSDFKGMGLELFICREILNLMDGSLKIESISGIGMAIIFEFTNYILEEEPIVEINNTDDKSVLIYLPAKSNQNIWKTQMEDLKISPHYVTGVSQFKMALETQKYTHIFIDDSEYDSLHIIIETASCESYTYIVTDYQHVYEDFGKCKIIRKPVYCVNISEILNDNWDVKNYTKPHKKEKVVFPEAKVLVVDDNIVNIKVILSILEKYGIKADMATGGEGCLNIIKEKKYDLLLLDQLMPGLSGVETLHKLRSMNDINSDIPVICITADFGADVRERMIAEGFQDYLSKPIKILYLDRMLRQYLPDRLMVVSEENDTEASTVNIKQINEPENKNMNELPNEKINKDPLEINTGLGIELVGGSEDVYNSILITYYQEGLRKLDEIPDQMVSQDLAIYSTNVHALKSSSASIGANNLSERFRELEMAGKSGKRDIVNNDTPEVLDQFRLLLDKVKNYLSDKGIEVASNNEADNESLGELITLDIDTVNDLKSNFANVNLKYCEEKIAELSSKNFGIDFNKKISEIKKSFEQFDYHSVKMLLEDLLEMVNK